MAAENKLLIPIPSNRGPCSLHLLPFLRSSSRATAVPPRHSQPRGFGIRLPLHGTTRVRTSVKLSSATFRRVGSEAHRTRRDIYSLPRAARVPGHARGHGREKKTSESAYTPISRFMDRLLRGRGGFAIGVLEFGILFLGGGLEPFAWEIHGSRGRMEFSAWTVDNCVGCLDFVGKDEIEGFRKIFIFLVTFGITRVSKQRNYMVGSISVVGIYIWRNMVQQWW